MPPVSPSLDLRRVRAHFPGLASAWTLLDNAGGSQVLLPVAERLRDYLLHTNVQLGASYEPSRHSRERVEQGVQAAADWIGTRDKSEVVLGPSTSMLLRNLATSLAKGWRPGDEVIVTDVDHEANIGPWVDLERTGIVVRVWKVDPDSLSLLPEDLEPLLGPRTRLVAFTHASNVVGTIHPLAEITKRIHAAGALVCVDGVAYAPHRLVDVEGWDVDFYAFSFYKVYGPHCAVLYARRELLEQMPGINHFFLDDEIPYKLQPGNLNYEMTYSLVGLWDYVESVAPRAAVGTNDRDAAGARDVQPARSAAGALDLNRARHTAGTLEQVPHAAGTADAGEAGEAGDAGDGRRATLASFFNRVAEHEEEIVEPLLARLARRPEVRILGRSQGDRGLRVPTVSFHLPGRSSEEIVRRVEEHRIGIRFGDFYARRLVDSLAIGAHGGVIRVSAVHYNTAAELEAAADAIEEAIEDATD